MKKNDSKSNNMYDIEKDKSKGIGFKNLTTGESPIFTTNKNGEIEFEIEVPIAKEEVVEKKKEKKKKKKKIVKEEVEVTEEEIEETTETNEDTESEEVETQEYVDEEEPIDFFKVFKTIIRIIVITAIVIGVIVVIWGLASPTFNIKNIKVSDTTKVDKEEILKIASGDVGHNIFATDFGKLEKQMQELPNVYKAEITRNLPDEIYIEIQERKEFFKILVDSSVMVVDQYGYIIGIESGDVYMVPMVHGFTQNHYEVGDTLSGTDITKFKNIKYFMDVADSIDFEYRISSMDYTNLNNLKFYIIDLDINISYGVIDKNAVNDKMIYLKEILNTCIKNGYKGELDISSDNYLENAIFKKKV